MAYKNQPVGNFCQTVGMNDYNNLKGAGGGRYRADIAAAAAVSGNNYPKNDLSDDSKHNKKSWAHVVAQNNDHPTPYKSDYQKKEINDSSEEKKNDAPKEEAFDLILCSRDEERAAASKKGRGWGDDTDYLGGGCWCINGITMYEDSEEIYLGNGMWSIDGILTSKDTDYDYSSE